MDNTVPPLRLWLFVLAFVVLVVGGYCGYAYVEYPNSDSIARSYSAEIGKAINKNNLVGPQQKSVVILGSSLAHSGLPYVPKIEKIISDSNKTAVVLRVVIHGLNMNQAEYSNFFSYITKYPPNYLFLETNNLLIDENSDGERKVFPVDALIDMLLKDIRAMVSGPVTVSNKPVRFGAALHAPGFDTLTAKGMISSTRHVRDFSNNKIANAAFAALIKKKTKVIFLEFPRLALFERVYLNTNEKTKLQSLYQAYLKTYGIPTWKYPRKLSDSDFLDRGHLNYRGAKKYEDWFTTEFNKLK